MEIMHQVGVSDTTSSPPVPHQFQSPGHPHLVLAATTAFPATTQRESSAQTASGEPPVAPHGSKARLFGILFVTFFAINYETI